jgi:hypothetical protein
MTVNKAHQAMITTFHTYPDLVTLTGERLAQTRWPEWHSVTIAEGVAATIDQDPECIVLRVASTGFADVAIGYMPGGLG